MKHSGNNLLLLVQVEFTLCTSGLLGLVLVPVKVDGYCDQGVKTGLKDLLFLLCIKG